MKRSKTHSSSDIAAEMSAAATPSPSSSTTASTKRRRNNPNECCVKCSGKYSDDPCDNCSRLKLDCSFTQNANGSQPHDKVARTTPNGIVTEAGTIRKRAQRAATCPGVNDASPTIFRRVAQVVTTTSNGRIAQESRSSSELETPTPSLERVFLPGSLVQDHLLRREVVLKHANIYFDHLFHMPCMGFLHPGTIYRLIDEDKLSPALAAGICSITADFVSPGPAGREFAVRCNERLEHDALRNFAFMDQEQLVFHVLATVYNWMSGPLSKVWMWTATAGRLIKCLQLNYEPDHRSVQVAPSEREIQRRGVWQIYIIDHFLSGGHDEHLLLPSNSIHIRLPCSDQVFRDDLPSTMETLDRNPSIPSSLGDYSLDACHVRLLTIRSQVLRTTKRFTDSSQNAGPEAMRPEQFMEHVNQFQIALHRFSDSLPENLRLSVANVDAHLLRPDRASYTMLHTWFCQTHIELYSFSLQTLKEQSMRDSASGIPWEFFLRSHQPFLFRCQQQAIAYAICLAQTWDYCLHNIKKGPKTSIAQGLVTVDWMVGACAVDVVDALLVARKHRLYEDLRGNTSAQMCYSKPIDDTLLASLTSTIVKLVDDLVKFLPRVEHYNQVIHEKLKEFDIQSGNVDRIGAVKSEDRNGTPSPTLPGPNDILPDSQLDAEVSPSSFADSASISDRFLRKKSVSSPYEKLPMYSGVVPNMQVAEAPSVMPYCLQQARASSPTGPFAAPTASNHQPSYIPPNSSINGPTPVPTHSTFALSMGPIFDTSIRPTVFTDAAMPQSMTMNHYPVGESTPQPSMQTPMVPGHNVYESYGPPYNFQNEHTQGPWLQHGQRDPHGYS
ncbi:hypothetical protein JX265_007608 [Neoarthrinium moseri]|uniref:Xylanolytic transcriptional activator regulatory domain-containing protein n=1 Tax=Neoarthrinium moseri TaxID=1658444 RepID=A0A9P9WJU2_9PEZI|nr:hypothetical protein JX265_007608 [Neoarthrinium moseri]